MKERELDAVLNNMVNCGVLELVGYKQGEPMFQLSKDHEKIVATKCAFCTDTVCNKEAEPTH